MFEIADIAIDPTLPTLRFRCDLKRCKGACCTLPGGRGAPLLNEEIAELQKALPSAGKYLSARHLEMIERQGFFEGTEGDFVTTCVDGRACVFVMEENGIAKCSLEHAFLKGETSWRKPLSCSLFPLRIDRGPQERIRFEFLADCEPAYEHGEATGTFLSDFLREALTRAYGPEWVRRFSDLCYEHRQNRDHEEETE